MNSAAPTSPAPRPAILPLPAQRRTAPAQDRPPLPAVCVVICAFTMARWEQVTRAVASVGRQTHPADEVVVVIDHNPALYERARAELAARVVQSTGTPGLSGARNTGLTLALADVVAFLDDDAYAEPEWLERLLAPYEDPRVLAVGGGVLAAFDGARPTFLPPEFDWVVGCSYRGQPETTAEVRNPIGANMSFRRSVFATVGGFAGSLGRVGDRPLGCEETELCIRALRACPGGRIVLEPSARVHHQVPDIRVTWAYFRARCYAEGLSKAVVAGLAGRQHGLSAERAYVTRTLPRGFLTGVSDAVLRGRPAGAARAAAIAVGLAYTTAGYVLGSGRLRSAGTDSTTTSGSSGSMTTMVSPSAAPERDGGTRLSDEITVVIPTRNAESLLEACLASVLACRPAAVVVVDGMSTDRTLELLAGYPVTVLSDEGRGLPAARLLGAETARTRLVALVDVDVVLRGPEALEDLAREFVEDGYTALQAAQESVSGNGYWGRALVNHHRTGRSKDWFGLVCTIFERDVLLAYGFDPRFVSGEDIELRWRLRSAGARVGVSRRIVVDHRFAGDDFAFARDQFLMDGRGLGRMVRKSGLRGTALTALPAAAAVRGMAMSLRRGHPEYVKYFLCFAAYNYLGMAGMR